MFEWSEELQMVRDAVRTFVDTEIRHREELEHGDLPPYDLLRKLYKTFGMDQMAADSFDKRISAEDAAQEGGSSGAASGSASEGKQEAGSERDRGNSGGGFTMLPIIELCKYSPGHGHRDRRVGRSHRHRDHVAGTIAQKERWALPLLTLEKIGAWAITEPGSGSDAFGVDEVDRAARRRRLRPQRVEDVHHQRPLRRHDRLHLQARRGQRPRRTARSSSFVLDRGMPGPRPVQAAAQDGPALVADGRAVPRRRPRRARPAARRDRGGVRRQRAARRRRTTFAIGAHRGRGDGARHRRACLELSVEYAQARACSSGGRSASSS